MTNPTKVTLRIILAAGLLGPFVLTEYSNGLEPYPAVLQPSGAYTVSTTDTILSFSETQLIAVQPDGSEVRVDTKAFMQPIPHHFWTRIAGTHFGLGDSEIEDFSLGIWTLSATRVPEATAEERQAVLNWIHQRLSAQGINGANTLVVRRMKLFFDVKAGVEAKRELIEQFDVDLS